MMMSVSGHALVLDEGLGVFIKAAQMAAALPSSCWTAWPLSKASSSPSWDWKPQAQASKPSHTFSRTVFSKGKIQLPFLLLPNQTTIPPDTNINHKALPAAVWGSCWCPIPSAQSTQFLLLLSSLTPISGREKWKLSECQSEFYTAVTHSWDPWCLSGLLL